MSVLPKSFSLKDGASVIIREATTDDAVAVIEMVKKILSESSFTLTRPEEIISDDKRKALELYDYKENKGSLYLVAETKGKLIGDAVFKNGKRKRK